MEKKTTKREKERKKGEEKQKRARSQRTERGTSKGRRRRDAKHFRNNADLLYEIKHSTPKRRKKATERERERGKRKARRVVWRQVNEPSFRGKQICPLSPPLPRKIDFSSPLPCSSLANTSYNCAISPFLSLLHAKIEDQRHEERFKIRKKVRRDWILKLRIYIYIFFFSFREPETLNYSKSPFRRDFRA